MTGAAAKPHLTQAYVVAYTTTLYYMSVNYQWPLQDLDTATTGHSPLCPDMAARLSLKTSRAEAVVTYFRF